MWCFKLAIVGALGLFLAGAEEIRITEGASDYQVFQRGPDQSADFKIGGTVVIANKKMIGKDIEARITTGSRTLTNFDWVSIAKIQKQPKWSGEIKGVPTGGPYRLEVRIAGSTATFSIDNLLVGDLWLLAGQSNMEGHGDLVDVQQPAPLVHSFDMADKWLVAEEPLHTLVSAADRVHWRLNENKEPERWTGERLDKFLTERKKGAGLGLSFASEMLQRTGIPIGLIPCAHGGTSMDQWSPALRDNGGDSLYGSMYRRFRAAGGNIKGMLWYQGESDTYAKAAPEFLHKFEDFVKAVRTDFKEQDLPIYYVQIGRHIDNKNIGEWNAVQSAQLAAESQLPHVAMVASIDCTLDDGIHISTRDLKRIARRLADEASHDLFPRVKNYGDLKRGPRPLAAKFENGVVTVSFASVNGKLESDGRISGFTIHDEKGEPVPLIYKSTIDPAAASTVLLYVGDKLPAHASLRYGFGKDPYCNLHDVTDQAVPEFGPLPIQSAP